MFRNGLVRKSYGEYFQLHKGSFKEPSEGSCREEKTQVEHSLLENNFIETSPNKKPSNFYSASPTPTKRPLSSKLTPNVATLNQALNGFIGSSLAHTYKMKTISAHANDNPESRHPDKPKPLMLALQRTPLRE
jgi:hypothetical protein